MKRTISSIIVSCLICSAFSQIPNPGFENWTNGTCFLYSYKTPDNWGTINSPTCILGEFVVEQTNDAHSGSYAIKLITKFLAGRTAPGLAVTGTINTSTEMTEGGFIYTSRPDVLTGWYKHIPVNTDTSSVSLVLWRRNGGVYEKVGEANFESPVAVSTYTRFTAPITYTSSSNPDSAKIELLSSYESSGQTGSAFIVDDLQFVSCNGLSVSLSTTPVSTVNGADGSATATPSGGTPPYNYYWSPSAQATQTIINLGAGSYCVTVADANGCTATTACQNVAGPDCSTLAVTVSTHDATTTGGNDGSAAATATGGNPPYVYVWTTSETTDSISGLTKAVYCVTVSDISGCTVTACGTVSDPGCTTLSLVVTSTDASTVGGSDGSATATVTGGTAGYTYLWNTLLPETTDIILNLPAGNYCVTVTDANNCNATDCVDVNEPSCSGFGVVATGTDVTSVGGNDGTASAAPSGGTAPYSYSWSNGDTILNLSGLPLGVYCVTSTDAVGCAADTCVTIIGPDCSSFSVNVTATPQEDYPNGTASANPSGGSSPITFSWSNGDSIQNLIGLSVGTYCVTATDNSGCIATACDSVGIIIGINSLLEAGIKLSPNPAKNNVLIEFENFNNTEKYRFRLFDAVGKTVAERILTTKSSVIPLDAILPGHYLYELKNTDDGKILTGKLVVE